MVNPTNIFAPEDMPKTNGPAIGFLKKVCSRYPDTDRAPPKTAAAKSLGSLIFHMILYSVEPSYAFVNTISKILTGDMLTLPVFTFNISITNKDNIRIKKMLCCLKVCSLKRFFIANTFYIKVHRYSDALCFFIEDVLNILYQRFRR